MKRTMITLVLVLALALTATIPAFAATSDPFADVPADSPYRAAIEWAVINGITNGTGEGKFSPNQECTLAQIVTFIWRNEDRPVSHQTTTMDESNPYALALEWALDQKLITFEEALTATTTPCTRGRAVQLLYGTYGDRLEMPEVTTMEVPFLDVPVELLQPAKWASIYGITNGTSPNTFSPDMVTTRGQIVTFLFRTYVAIAQHTEPRFGIEPPEVSQPEPPVPPVPPVLPQPEEPTPTDPQPEVGIEPPEINDPQIGIEPIFGINHDTDQSATEMP